MIRTMRAGIFDQRASFVSRFIKQFTEVIGWRMSAGGGDGRRKS